jgi:chromosomal replication initiation ATPase DnaA
LCDDGRQPVVLLDDFDDLAHNEKVEDSFFAALRSLATSCKVSYVVVSQEPLYELETMRPEASTLCGICRQIKLPPLAEQESRELLLGSLEQAQVTWPAPIVELVLNKGRNEPWRLQLAGHEVFQVWQENGGKLREPEAAALEGRIDRAVARWAAR